MKRLATILISTLLLAGSFAIAQPPKPAPFSADMTFKPKQGETMTGKFYMGDRKIRMEMNSQMGPMIMINDMAAKKSYMLMTSQKMYMEHDINDAPRGGPMAGRVPKLSPECDPDHFTCKDAGTETVNGRLCHKWVYTAKDAGNESANSTQWIDAKILTMVRVLNGDGSQMDFNNIKEGPQDDSLFKVPSDYQPFNPMNMMQGRRPH